MKVFLNFIKTLILNFVYSAVSVLGVWFGFAIIGEYVEKKKNDKT